MTRFLTMSIGGCIMRKTMSILEAQQVYDVLTSVIKPKIHNPNHRVAKISRMSRRIAEENPSDSDLKTLEKALVPSFVAASRLALLGAHRRLNQARLNIFGISHRLENGTLLEFKRKKTHTYKGQEYVIDGFRHDVLTGDVYMDAVHWTFEEGVAVPGNHLIKSFLMFDGTTPKLALLRPVLAWKSRESKEERTRRKRARVARYEIQKQEQIKRRKVKEDSNRALQYSRFLRDSGKPELIQSRLKSLRRGSQPLRVAVRISAEVTGGLSLAAAVVLMLQSNFVPLTQSLREMRSYVLGYTLYEPITTGGLQKSNSKIMYADNSQFTRPPADSGYTDWDSYMSAIYVDPNPIGGGGSTLVAENQGAPYVRSARTNTGEVASVTTVPPSLYVDSSEVATAVGGLVSESFVLPKEEGQGGGPLNLKPEEPSDVGVPSESGIPATSATSQELLKLSLFHDDESPLF